MTVFRDRVDAGRQLAERLAFLRGQDVVVLGLPRGGVPVAFEVAAALNAPLDVVVVRKLGVPFQPELAMGHRRGWCQGARRRRVPARTDQRGRPAQRPAAGTGRA